LTGEQMHETSSPTSRSGHRTGKTATTQQAQDATVHPRTACEIMTKRRQKVRIQYGGSVKPNNAKELMSQRT